MTAVSTFRPPPIHHPLWRLSSRCVVCAVGLLSKGFLKFGAKTHVYGLDRFLRLLEDPKRTRPIITVSNHASTLDDPLLWGLLPTRVLLHPRRVRWALGAKEICHKNRFLDLFFTLGKTLPVIRGDGIYQPVVDFALERLNQGDWVHLFPEARVHQADEMLPFKWGTARLILDCQQSPIVLPIWHEGLAHTMPLKSVFPKWNQPLRVVFGEPICVDDLRREHAQVEKAAAIIDKMLAPTKLAEIRRDYERARLTRVNAQWDADATLRIAIMQRLRTALENVRRQCDTLTFQKI